MYSYNFSYLVIHYFKSIRFLSICFILMISFWIIVHSDESWNQRQNMNNQLLTFCFMCSLSKLIDKGKGLITLKKIILFTMRKETISGDWFCSDKVLKKWDQASFPLKWYSYKITDSVLIILTQNLYYLHICYSLLYGIYVLLVSSGLWEENLCK